MYSSLNFVIELSHELMMRKVGNQRFLLVTTSVPGHHRPLLSKQLKCQSLHCGSAGQGGRNATTSPVTGCGKGARGMLRTRHRRDGQALFRSSRRAFYRSDQTRATCVQYSSENQRQSATSAMAQALASPWGPPKKQSRKCLQFIQETILF